MVAYKITIWHGDKLVWRDPRYFLNKRVANSEGRRIIVKHFNSLLQSKFEKIYVIVNKIELEDD